MELRLSALLSIFCLSAAMAQNPMQPMDSATLCPQLTQYQKNRDKMLHADNIGKPQPSRYRVKDLRGAQLVKRGIDAPKGLSGRHIAMWQSHGRYFDFNTLEWQWQRPSLFQTTEDLFTQSFLVPFLVPMLENAGANVLLPRERDWHDFELIIDNDGASEGILSRAHGHVETKGTWKSVAPGFADLKEVYTDEDNPFETGTYLQCRTLVKKGSESSVSWYGSIPAKDEYAVYVSYRSVAKSTSDARYTVYTAGGPVELRVNQRMGSGTWIYLGTFEFAEGEQKLVSLGNRSSVDGFVTADAVKIGGGTGKIARGIKDSTEYTLSGLPAFAEGARYFMQWSGIPAKVWSQNESMNDYRDDLMSRGAWVKHISGGSWANPKQKGLNIPIDLSFAWHTDAGSRPDASIVGTLGIYTLRCEGSSCLPNGRPRATSRELTELLLSQIENDLGRQWDSLWTIRDVWNKSYSESRTCGTPSVLLELLSHQNFEDMKYGLDPVFRFHASRAVYKAILKYLSMHYGCQYAVQPLPVKAFGVHLNTRLPAKRAELRWKENTDTLEPTAKPEYFIVYTRVDGGGWDRGQKFTPAESDGWYEVHLPVQEGHIYSYRVAAANQGGLSFNSETLSAGVPLNARTEEDGMPKKITVVNAFHRVSGPKWFDTAYYAGFDTANDSGVPYLRDWAYVGEQYEFNRSKKYGADNRNGFGACHEDYMDVVIGGNSFDYPYTHGQAIYGAGYAFDSCSAEAAGCDEDFGQGIMAVDIICGKECVVQTGARSPRRGGIYSGCLMKAVRNAVSNGCGIMISGAYIAREAEEAGAGVRTFVRDSLGFGLRREHGTRTGGLRMHGSGNESLSFPVKPCTGSYCVENPDALSTYRLGSSVYMDYSDTKLSAAVRADFGTYRTAAFAFPLEILESAEARERIIRETLEYLISR